MSRLNLTLDDDTHARLTRYATQAKLAVATLARQLLREAVERREAEARRRKLAADYAAGRADAREILDDLEAPQLEGLLDAD
jgi:hypothetical protein